MNQNVADLLTQKLIQDGYNPRESELIAFHMTDWLDDLNKLHEMFQNIDSFKADELTDRIVDFLTHAPNHINAAAYLMTLGAPQDVFDLGFFEKKKSKG